MSFAEFCEKNGWEFIADPATQEEHRRAWTAYVEAEMRRPRPPFVNRGHDGTITKPNPMRRHTLYSRGKRWRDDLENERRTAWYRTRIRLILPHRIVILKASALGRLNAYRNERTKCGPQAEANCASGVNTGVTRQEARVDPLHATPACSSPVTRTIIPSATKERLAGFAA